MTTTVEAIYELGKLVLPRPLSLPEKSRVRVTIETAAADLFNDLAAMANDPQVQREIRFVTAK